MDLWSTLYHVNQPWARLEGLRVGYHRDDPSVLGREIAVALAELDALVADVTPAEALPPLPPPPSRRT